MKMGENYLWGNIPKLDTDPYETIGFELIFPTAMQCAEKLKLNLSYGDTMVHKYTRIREKKLSLVPRELIYSKKASLSYSMEFMGECVDEKKLNEVQLENGSLGDSPAATAFKICIAPDNKAISYLRTCLSLNGYGSSPSQYPYEIFEKAWVLYNYSVAGIPPGRAECPHIRYLASVWKDTGIAWADSFPVPDSDDSAFVFKILNSFGYKMDGSFFEKYEKDDYYICYDFEINPSVSANIHILDAIKDCHDYPRRDHTIDKLLRYLSSARIDGDHWQDKWHTSPYYATIHAILAIGELDRTMIEPTINWLIRNQNHDGSWGRDNGNMEDTGFALQGLIFYHNNLEGVDPDIINRGVSWILNHWNDAIPELWIAKGLYNPTNVVSSLILSVLYSYQVTIRREFPVPIVSNDLRVMI